MFTDIHRHILQNMDPLQLFMSQMCVCVRVFVWHHTLWSWTMHAQSISKCLKWKANIWQLANSFVGSARLLWKLTNLLTISSHTKTALKPHTHIIVEDRKTKTTNNAKQTKLRNQTPKKNKTDPKRLLETQMESGGSHRPRLTWICWKPTSVVGSGLAKLSSLEVASDWEGFQGKGVSEKKAWGLSNHFLGFV